MRQRQPRSWILLISAICALIYLALQYSSRDWMAPQPAAETRRYPDTFMRGIRNVHYDSEGRLQYRLSALELTHYESVAEPYSLILKPEIVINSAATENPWTIVAERGTRLPRRQQVTLEQQVHASSLHPQYGPVEVLTENIVIDTARQFARTEKPVTMRSARGVTTAVGLEADIKAGRVELLSEVKGTYEPQ